MTWGHAMKTSSLRQLLLTALALTALAACEGGSDVTLEHPGPPSAPPIEEGKPKVNPNLPPMLGLALSTPEVVSRAKPAASSASRSISRQA